MDKYKDLADFDDNSLAYEVYLVAVLLNAINPNIDLDQAQDSIEGFVLYYSETGLPVTAVEVLQLAEELKNGPTPAGDLH